MIGYCGINCSRCAAYTATATVDEKLMEETVTRFGDGKGTRNDWICLGCLHEEPGLIAKYCATCTIRSCALEHGVTNCAACPDYDGCKKLQPFIEKEGADVALRMRWLREAYVARTHGADPR